MPTDLILLLFIVLIVILVWRGPKMLPEWGAAIGKTIREARGNATKGLDDKPTELSDGGIDTAASTASRRDTTNAPRS